jgi:hypothetical protein
MQMREVGFDVSFRDCPAKGGTGGHPTCSPLKANIKMRPSLQ